MYRATGSVLSSSVLQVIIQLTIVVLAAVHPQNSGAQDPVLDKPETPGLEERVKGHVILANGRSELIAVSIPDRKESILRRTLRQESQIHPTFHSVSGPDSKGRIAYVEDHYF